MSGRQLGEWTSDDGKNIDNLDYEASIMNRGLIGGGGSKYYNGGSAVAGGEFGTSTFTPINPVTAGTTQNASRYTVRSGDTLAGIAAMLWGDASLWYKLAEANGLSADASLAAGQSLSVPVGVVKNGNSAATFNPYDTARATGDLSPTTNKPPKKGKCGVFGQILVAIVTIAVTIVAAPLGPLAPVVGNVAGQLFGMATGIQQGGFNWKSLAIATISAGLAPPGTGSIVGDVVAGAVANAAVQGIAVATDLQDNFDWVGVAAAGVSAGVGTAMGGIKGFNQLSRGAQAALGASARAIANAATRSIANGSSFGDNLLAGLPDVLAQTIGGFIQDGVSGRRSAGTGTNAGGTVAADTAAANEPVAGVEGGGQVGNDQTDDGEVIVVRGRRGLADYAAQEAAFRAGSVTAELHADIVNRTKVGGPDNGRPVDLRDPVRWADPWRKGEFFGRYAISEGNVEYWQDFVSEQAWDDAKLDFAMKSAGNALVGIGSEIAGGIWDTAKGVAGFVYETGETIVDLNLALHGSAPAATRLGSRWNSLKDGASAIRQNPDILKRAIAEPYRQMFEEGRIRSYTAMVSGTAVGAVAGPSVRYSPTIRTFAPAAKSLPAYNVSTTGMTVAERQAVVEYAQRSNVWLAENGGTTVQSTAGTLRSQANAAARTERLNAARTGTPYQGQAGHVPDTALTGTAQPPAGWLDMPGRSNSVVGGGLSSRIGKPVSVITVDGRVP